VGNILRRLLMISSRNFGCTPSTESQMCFQYSWNFKMSRA